MKFSLILMFSIVLAGFCQSQDINKYFGQAHFSTEDSELISNTEKYIREQDGIWMVRIDPTNGNVLIYTTELPFWTEEEFISLFGKHGDKVECPYIGIVRKDKIRPFPFKDCE